MVVLLSNCNKNTNRVLFGCINSIVSPPPQHALLLSDDYCNVLFNHFVSPVMDLRSGSSACEDGPQITLNDLTRVIGKMKPFSHLLEILPPSAPLLVRCSIIKARCVPFYFKHAAVTPLLKKPTFGVSSDLFANH